MEERDYIEDTNENDYIDYPKLSRMSKYERERRILDLWHKSFVKARGAAVILQTFTDLKIKIQLFGRQLLVNN